MMNKETWLSSDKALEMGFVDEIIGVDSNTSGITLNNAFGTVLPESTIEKIRNMCINRLQEQPKDDFLIQKNKTQLQLLKMKGV